MAVFGFADAASGATGTVFSDGTKIVAHYEGAAGEVNHVTATVSAGVVTFSDPGKSMSVGAGCTTSGTSTMTCRHTGGIEGIQMALGEEDDWAKNDSSLPSTINTGQLPGDGQDTVYGGSAADLVNTHANKDTIYGNGGPDTLHGGGGDDTLYGQGGDDHLIGDEEGSPQGSNKLYGGSGGDSLVSSELVFNGFNQVVSGGTGMDFIYGAGGADTLTGGDGIDLLAPRADNGADSVSGGADKDVVDLLSNNDTWAWKVTLDNLANDGAHDGVFQLMKNDNIHSDIETVWGGPFDDEITGTVGPQELNGYGGNDTLDGRTGADVLIGNGGTGDVASYANHTSKVTVTIDNNANDGSVGENDDVQTSVENVVGSQQSDTLFGSTGKNTLIGSNGADTLNGLADDDTLIGQGSNDKFVANPGADDMYGGDGVDTGDYSSRGTPQNITLDTVANDGSPGEHDNLRAEQVFGGTDDDQITGDDEGDFLEGRGGDDTITALGNVDFIDGGNGVDTIGAGEGDDVINNGTAADGADTVAGGAGSDLSSYQNRANALNVNLNDVADDGETGEGDDVRTTVEKVTGGNGPDVLNGSAEDNTLSGGGGGDTIAAGAGEDTVNGNAGVDALFGGDDNDDIAGGPDADSMAGGPGIDKADYSTAGTGINVTIDDVANDGIPAEGDNVMTTIENVLGGRFNDSIDGDSDPNGLVGGLAADLLRGFGGADLITGGNGGDDLRGGPGPDELHAVDATQDSLLCGTEVDDYAADGIDTIANDCENALP
jgi:Ca2+-binding RTX toxin-like protein